MNAKIKRCYEILELSPGADALAVRKSYLRLVKAWHPDRLGHEQVAQKAANEKLKEINLSYEVLTAYLTSAEPAQREGSRSPDRPAQPSHIAKAQELFEEGLRTYRARSFKEALGLFKQAAGSGNARAQYAVGYVLHQHRQFFR